MDVETQYECGLNLKATELRLGLPGVDDLDQKQKSPIVRCNKRASMDKTKDYCGSSNRSTSGDRSAKQQVVGWPPVQSHRKNGIHLNKMGSLGASGNGTYIKVSKDGVPYLRKTNLEEYKGYPELLKALMKMFSCSIGQYSESEGYNGSEYIPAYEDKEGDWMLVGDVPFEMFISSCKKLKLFKGSKAKGLTLFL